MAISRIGQLDKRVTIQSPRSTTSAAGATSVEFVNLADTPVVWAAVESMPGGAELDEAGHLQPRTFWRVTIRRRTGLTPKMRLLYGPSQRALYIKDMGDDSKRSEFMELVCTEYP